MSHELRMASDFYRVARNKKPAVRMLLNVAAGLSVLLVWASLTPISDSVGHLAKIVPKNGLTNAKNGAISVSASFSGKVVAVPVAEGQEVNKGDVLIFLDTEEMRTRRESELRKIDNLELENKAKVEQVRLVTLTYRTRRAELAAKLDGEKSRVNKLASERLIKINSANSELKRSARELDRSKKLVAQRAISQSELDAAEADYLRAKETQSLAILPLEDSRISELSSSIEALESGHQETVHQIEMERLSLVGRISVARSEIALLELRIGQSEIVSPIDGHVSTCGISVGDWVSPGLLDVTVAQTGFIAESLLPSQLISNVKAGDEARIMVDGIDWMVNGSIDATVTSISPELCHDEIAMGDGSTLVVDGYRVLFELEPGEYKKWNSIRIGMTGLVQIETGQKNLAVYLLEKAVGESIFKSR